MSTSSKINNNAMPNLRSASLFNSLGNPESGDRFDGVLHPEVDVDYMQNGASILAQAVLKFEYELAAELLKKGADACTFDENGMSPLSIVAFRCCASFKPVFTDDDMLAALDFLTMLLRNGVDPNFPDKNGRVPLKHFIKDEFMHSNLDPHNGAVFHLLDAGAVVDPEIVNKMPDSTQALIKQYLNAKEVLNSLPLKTSRTRKHI